jgi:hypothetical protein
MVAVLIDSRAEWLSSDDLARRIAELDLYRRPKDEEHAEPFQIELRARKYPQLFDGANHRFERVRLHR